MTIAVLGIDGSGKSTISRKIAEEFSDRSSTSLISDDICLYEDSTLKPIQPLISDRVREMISSYAKKAKSLKIYKIPKITELLLRNQLFFEIRRWYNPDLIVIDGSPLLNMTAWAVMFKKDQILDRETCAKIIRILTDQDKNIKNSDPIFSQFPESRYFKRLGLNNLVLPEYVIFIDVSPETAVKRIDLRGEEKQVHETSQKLSRLREAYLMVCEVIRNEWGIPVVIVDGEKSLGEVSEVSVGFVKEIIREKQDLSSQ